MKNLFTLLLCIVACITNAQPGAPATALSFDGTDDFTISNNLGTSITDKTLSAWVKLNTLTQGGGGLVSIEENGGGAFDAIVYNETGNGWGFGSENFYRTAWSGVLETSTNGWVHIAATYSNYKYKLYRNGVLILQTTTFIAKNFSNSSRILVGKRHTTGGNPYLNADIDEVHVWNRVLCQNEIQNNMQGELNPALQSGLKVYYKYNQGVIGNNNTTINSALDASGNNYTAALTNFSLGGSTSNWVGGTVVGNAATYTPAALSGVSGGQQVCQFVTVQAPGTNYVDGACNLIGRLKPTGASPVSGLVNTCVKIDASVQTYGGQAYVQRHYDMEPATNAATSTGTVTLYFTQAEFDAFNMNRGSLMPLPVNSGDAAGIANLLVMQCHGIGTTPGNYTGTTEIKNPADADIIWNTTSMRWEITFDVTGFSGFFIKTSSSVLPVKLVNFSGIKQNGFNLLQWKTTNDVNTKEFLLEHSIDGLSFNSIASIAAIGTANNAYSYNDKKTHLGKTYYRLKMIDNDGKYTYSNILNLTGEAAESIIIYPNPVINTATLTVNDLSVVGTKATVKDVKGSLIKQITLKHNFETIDLTNMPQGIYIVTLTNGSTYKLIKQ